MDNNQIELFESRNKNHRVTLYFHPSYNSRHFGADYGQRYHYDPLYRIETDMKIAKCLYQQFSEYGMGNPDPKPVLGVGIQPLDFMNAAMGGRMLFKKEATIETPDKPLSGIKTIEDIRKFDNIDWESNFFFQNVFVQIEQMRHAYSGVPISYVQSIWSEGPAGQESLLIMHTPYTTAFRLFGQEILELMILERDFATAIFEWLMRQYLNLWEVICQKMDWKGTKIHFGDCAATMLSPAVYESICIPLYQKLMQDFDSCVVHSCGPSSHLLESFSKLPKVSQVQLGYGTDLSRARHLFCNSSIVAYYDPGRLISIIPQEIERDLWEMAERLEDDFEIQCSGADTDTPQDNIHTFLNTARKINHG